MSLAEAQTHHLTCDYPEYFLVEDSVQTAGAELVLVHTPDAGFRPNLVVTSVESNAALLEQCRIHHCALHPLLVIGLRFLSAPATLITDADLQIFQA